MTLVAYVGSYGSGPGDGGGIDVFDVSPDGRGPVEPAARVHAFAVDQRDGRLSWLNSRLAPGPRPTFVSVDEVRRVVVTANHGDDDTYIAGRLDILQRNGLRVWAISNHLAGQAVCDDPIDARHRAILPRRRPSTGLLSPAASSAWTGTACGTGSASSASSTSAITSTSGTPPEPGVTHATCP